LLPYILAVFISRWTRNSSVPLPHASGVFDIILNTGDGMVGMIAGLSLFLLRVAITYWRLGVGGAMKNMSSVFVIFVPPIPTPNHRFIGRQTLNSRT